MKKKYEKFFVNFQMLSSKEKLSSVLMALAILCAIGIIFYDSIVAIFFLSPLGIVLIESFAKKKILNKKRNIAVWFKDGLLSVSASLSAGYSVENAFIEAIEELKLLYGEDGFIVKEFEIIKHEITIGNNIEDAILRLAKRLESEDANTFAEIFRYAKRSGGDMIEIIKTTAAHIEEKQRVIGEIEVMIAAKRFEQNIMNVLPMVIILYINIALPGLIDSMYHNIFGVIIMTILLAIYIFAIYCSFKIMKIEV